jgi:PAS domain S-box-containing protein
MADESDSTLHNLVSALEKIDVHDHLCLIYQTQGEQFSAVMPFLRIGLARGERCLYVIDDNTAAMVINGMKAAGLDVESAVTSGSLTIISTEETYLKQGFFDPDWMVDFLKQATKEAKTAGFSALRVTGEMTWVLRGAPGTERLMEYEAKLNSFFPENDALAICQYNRDFFPPESIKDLIDTHPLVICGGMVCSNSYYVPPDDLLTEERPAREIDRLLANIINRQKAEDELSRMNERFSLATHAARLGVWDWDIQSNELLWDDMMYELYGIKREAFSGAYEAWLQGIHPDDRTSNDEASKRARSGEREYDTEFRVVWPDGTIHYLKEHGRIVRDADGAPLRMIGINFDITARKSMDGALFVVAQRGWLADAENFFDALARYLGENLDMDYVVIDRIDEDPAIAETVALYARGAIVPNMRYALKGTPCENVLGRRLCVYPQGVQQLFPEDNLLAEMGVQSYIGIPLWDCSGQPIGLIALMGSKPCSDAAPATQLLQLVATRAAAELTRERNDCILRRREHEFRTLAESLPDSIVRYDREGRIIYVNPVLEKNLGAAAANMIGTSVREFQANGSYEAYAQAVVTALASGENGEIEYILPVPGKEPIVHQIRLIVERDEHGEVTGVLAIGRDITERKRTEKEIRTLNAELERRVAERTAQLEAANRELEAFCYSVSHDLRAPLRHIDGYVDLLVSRCRDGLNDKGLHYVDTIADSARGMGVLIDDLLQFSRTGRAEMRWERLEMHQALQEALADIKESYSGRVIEWSIGALPSVRGDYALLRQVWANLLGNAVKYTRSREAARIEVSAREENGEIIFTVTDNGVGFDMRYADKLFGVFQRLHSQEEFEGTGIGLAIVQRIISRHGGRVWAEAELDRGATFSFTLPSFKEENHA